MGDLGPKASQGTSDNGHLACLSPFMMWRRRPERMTLMLKDLLTSHWLCLQVGLCMDVVDNSEKRGNLKKAGNSVPLSMRGLRGTVWSRAQFQHIMAAERKRQLGMFS